MLKKNKALRALGDFGVSNFRESVTGKMRPQIKSDFPGAKEQKRQVFSLEGSGSADYASDGSLGIRFVSI